MDEEPNILKKPWQVDGEGAAEEMIVFAQRCAAMAATFYLELLRRGMTEDAAEMLTGTWLIEMMQSARRSE